MESSIAEFSLRRSAWELPPPRDEQTSALEVCEALPIISVAIYEQQHKLQPEHNMSPAQHTALDLPPQPSCADQV